MRGFFLERGRYHRAMTAAFNPILGREVRTEPTPFARDGWTLVRCHETGFVFLPDPPSYDALATEQAWESTYAAERARRARDEPALVATANLVLRVRQTLFPRRNPFAKLLARELRARAADASVPTVVDIGCADARFTRSVADAVAARGGCARFVGIEVSRALAAAGTGTLAPIGGSVLCASALDGVKSLGDRSVASILMSSFLEHEAKPLELLREAARALEPGGAAIVKVPNFACLNRLVRGARWCGFRYPDHVNYFTPATLALLAAKAGLACEQPLSMRSPFSDNMYALLRRTVA